MALILEQHFPLGRFHSTRWKTGAFGDLYGEWPPSPWRLLRALACRWFQWSRETGNNNQEELNVILEALSSELPEFYLSPNTKKGDVLKQYLPVGLEEKYKYKKNKDTGKKELDYQYRETSASLSEDHYRLVSPNDAVYWIWPNTSVIDTTLLENLLIRMLYFGRVESFTRICRIDRVPELPGFQYVRLTENRVETATPVLAPDPHSPERLSMLLQPTDHPKIKDPPIPPGTRWYYALLPPQPKISITRKEKPRFPGGLTHLQFAIGGQVLPSVERWSVVTSRFRSRIVKELCRILTGNIECDFRRLDSAIKTQMRGITGKDENGEPLKDHSQVYFAVIPDENGDAARLAMWRHKPFSQHEIEAVLSAAKVPLGWDYATPKWKIKLLPLPFNMPLSGNVTGQSKQWESLTPFIPPRQRKRFRKNGKLRPGETPDAIAKKLCQTIYGLTPISAKMLDEGLWLSIHVNAKERNRMDEHSSRLPGYRLRLEFAESVAGPIAIGDSSHYGFGIFRPV